MTSVTSVTSEIETELNVGVYFLNSSGKLEIRTGKGKEEMPSEPSFREVFGTNPEGKIPEELQPHVDVVLLELLAKEQALSNMRAEWPAIGSVGASAGKPAISAVIEAQEHILVAVKLAEHWGCQTIPALASRDVQLQNVRCRLLQTYLA